MARMSTEEEREAIEGRYEVVIARFDAWPDEVPEIEGIEDADVLSAWSYVTGYANALGMTALELLDAVGIGWEEPEQIEQPRE